MPPMRVVLGPWFAGFLLFAAAHIAVADDLEDGWRSYIRSDFTTAYKLLSPLAEQGNSRAQSILATMYRFGEGVEVDAEKAAFLTRQASLQGSVAAQYDLSQLYLTGLGVEQSIAHAIMWLTIALDEIGFEEFVRDSGASVRQPITEFRRNVVAQANFLDLARALDMAATCRNSKYQDCE